MSTVISRMDFIPLTSMSAFADPPVTLPLSHSGVGGRRQFAEHAPRAVMQ